MAMPSVSQNDWTVAKLHALPDDGNRYEIIDGVLYVTPSPRLVHGIAAFELAVILRPYARSMGMDVLLSPADIQYSERTVVQPDVFVFRRGADRPMKDWADVQPLQLAIEVLSPSTQRRDRTVKRDLYQAQGVPEYWIVDIDARAIERWLPHSTVAELLTTSLAWQPVSAHAPLSIDVIEYFRTVRGD